MGFLPATVRKRSTIRELDAGEILFHRGDRALWIFEVEQGRLQLIRYTVDGHPVPLHSARAGELFAEAALFAGTYRCDAVACATSRVRMYPKQELLAAFRHDSTIAERFMAILARQIHALRARVEERNIRSASARVLHHLALNVGRDGRTSRLDGSLIDLAAEIGLTHEALYRTLARLEKSGAIERKGADIILKKSPGL
jgi:CRP-like cAMP-binding protein